MSPAARSERMSRIRSKDSGAELRVRRLVHAMGYRYRLHQSELPGRPDLVFRARRKVIFVHGCFWHRHEDPCCKLARLPKSRLDFWLPKLERNRLRDEEVRAELAKSGWTVLVIWECELTDLDTVTERVREFLDG